MKPPTEEEAFAGRAAMAEQSIEELVQKTDVAKFEEQVDHLLEQHDAKTLVAALLNEVTKSDASEIKVKITPERPLPRKKGGNKGGKGGGGYRGGNRRGGNGRRSNGNSSNGGGRGGKWNNDRKGGGKSRFGRDDRNHNGGKRNDRNSGNKGGSNRQFVIKEK